MLTLRVPLQAPGTSYQAGSSKGHADALPQVRQAATNGSLHLKFVCPTAPSARQCSASNMWMLDMLFDDIELLLCRA